MTARARRREGWLFTVVFLRCASASCKTAQFSETCRRNASFRNTATLLRMLPRYQMGRTMTKVGFPTTVAEAAHASNWRRCLHARIHEGRGFSGAGTQAITQPRNSCRGAISCYSLGAENLVTCPGFCSELSVAVLPH